MAATDPTSTTPSTPTSTAAGSRTAGTSPVPTPTSTAAGSRTVGTSPVARAFRVLQVAVAAGETLGVRELSRRAGLPRSTVSRIVGVLTELGMLDRTADGAVLPGSALATLQPSGAAPALLDDRLRPLLAELVETVGESAALSVDDGDRLLYLSVVLADHPVSVPDVHGERHEFHLVAPGILTMAWWPSDRLAEYLDRGLDDATEHSVTATKAVRKRLARVRANGWCWTDQELDVGVNGVAVPVVADGSLIATISLFGPAYRLNPEARPTLAADLAAMVATRAPHFLA